MGNNGARDGHERGAVKFRLSLFDNKFDASPKPVERTWEEICARIARPQVRADKDGPLFSPASFDPPQRKKENVRYISELVFDYDHGADFDQDLEVWRGHGMAFAAYTTHSSYRETESNPESEERFRVIIPLLEPIPAAEFPKLWRWAAKLSGGKVDPQAKDASRMFYTPAIAEDDARYRHEIHNGAMLDWRSLDLKEIESPRPAPTLSGHEKADAYGRKALESEIGKVAMAAKGGRNSQLNASAFALGQLIGGGILQRFDVEDALHRAALGAGLGEPEIRQTIKSGIEAGMREPRSAPERNPQSAIRNPQPIRQASGEDGVPKSQPPPSPNGHTPSFAPPSPRDPGGKISIDVSFNHLPTMHALCWEAIRKENSPPILFRFGNTIVRAAKSDTGGTWLQIVTPEIMCHHLSNWAHWHKNEIKLTLPPMRVIKDVLSPLEILLPPLRRVVTVPVFAPDGSLRLAPGYNASSGVLYAPAPGFTALAMPDQITGKDVDEANSLICGEVLIDFPFASTADRDNAVALYLLPFCRDLIDGPTPNHLIEASMPGSGKGKLADALLLPSVGADLGLITPPRDEDEWRKQITSALIAGKQIILIDNVIHRLDSSALAAAWTGNVWDDRILGQKEKANIPIRCVWVMTGNNIAVSTELARRCVRMRLTPRTDRPEERNDFRHPDLLLWCAEHRAELVRAAHVIIKWWVQQRMPPPKNLRPLGSYERWTRVMGGILEAAGYQKFLANYREFQTKADTERTARALFCATWYDWSQMQAGREAAVTAQLVAIAEGIEGLPIKGSTDRALQTSLGIWLRANADVIVEYSEQLDSERIQTRHFRIVADKARAGKQPWIIEKLIDEVHEVHESG